MFAFKHNFAANLRALIKLRRFGR